MDGEDDLLHDAISATLAGIGQGGAPAHVQSDLREYPLQIVPALGSCRRILYTTKIHWLIRLAGDFGHIPADVMILWRSGPLCEHHRALVRAIVQTVGAPLFFVGDLDPLDLATYATLIEGVGSPLTTTSYLGIADSWLERCELDLRSQPDRSLDLACIPMGAEERRGFERLKQIPVDWLNLIGPRALSLLDSGLKLELEGASNPGFYWSNERRLQVLANFRRRNRVPPMVVRGTTAFSRAKFLAKTRRETSRRPMAKTSRDVSPCQATTTDPGTMGQRRQRNTLGGRALE